MNHLPQKLIVAALQNKSGVITAFFTQMPGLVVQGSSQSDVMKKLDSLLDHHISRLESVRHNYEIVTQTIA